MGAGVDMDPAGLRSVAAGLIANEGVLEIQPLLSSASDALCSMSGSRVESAWNAAAGSVLEATSRFRRSSADLQCKLDECAAACENADAVASVDFRSVEA